MSPYLQEVFVTIHHQEALKALLQEKQAIAAQRRQTLAQRMIPPFQRTAYRWRLRRRARRARLSKRSYATPWLADLYRIVESQRSRDA